MGEVILSVEGGYERRIPWDRLFEREREHLNKQEQALIDFARQWDTFQALCDNVEWIIKAWISPDWETLFIEDKIWNRGVSTDWGNTFSELKKKFKEI